LGVTGHRATGLAGTTTQQLQQRIEALLSQLTAAVAAIHRKDSEAFASEVPCLRLVSALADGADSLAARVALAGGWRLDVCLPFPQDVYAQDFTPGESRGQFLALSSSATAVFVLPGRRDGETAAYEAAGRIMLEQSDLLLALWDGEPARGRGGTAQIVEEAVLRHVPVVHIDTRSDAAPLLLWSGLSSLELEQPTIETVPRAPACDVLDAVTAALTVPPDNDVDRRMLRRFFTERSRERTPALPYPLLLAMTGIRGLARADLKPPQPDACAAQLRERLQAAPDTGLHAEMLQRRLLPQFGVADAAASYFAQIFRSGFVANFGLAALAVLLATSSLLVPALKFPLIVTELAVIFVILANTRGGTQARWHERWMDDRHLAEQLRSLALGSLIGDLDLRSGEARDAAVIPGWVRWLSRATARELGLPSAVADQVYLEKVRAAMMAMIDDQLAYHTHNEAQIRRLDHRLHHAGKYLFGATIVACIVWIALKLLHLPMRLGAGVDLTAIVTVITAALPAMGAALYGMRMQGDFAGIADRALVMVKRLARLKRAIESDSLDFARVAARLRRLSDIMLTDVADWRTTYQARPLTLPG
jgi:hypothetical protein